LSITKKISLWILYFITVSFLFDYYHHLDISPCRETKKDDKVHFYECHINANISKKYFIGIGVDDILDSLSINSKEYDLTEIKQRYKIENLNDYKQGYSLYIDLKRGDNTLNIRGINTGGRADVFINYGLTSYEYILGFIFIAIPVIYLLFKAFFILLDRRIKIKNFNMILPVLIILAGIFLRIFVVNSVANWEHQHDYNGHVETIKYYAQNPWTPPQADKGLQYPQQPLYYLLSGVIYNIGDFFNLTEDKKLYAIRMFAVVLAGLSMFIGWKLVLLYTQNTLLINIFLSFLSFTPLFVLMGAFVSNDTLNSFFGILSIYAISLYYKKATLRYFILSTVVILLAMLTKVSSILLTIYFAVIILYHYKSATSSQVKTLQREALFFSVAVLFVFGWTLFKAYIPMSGEFRFVNSALYSNQIIPYMGISYFFTFNWFDLIEHAQATVLYDDGIRFSLPTYLYGTMFLEDHIYAKKYLEGGIFKLSAQITYILGIIYLIGSIFYIIFFKKLETLHKFLIIPIAINLLLIIKFLNDYWVVCNSHFRYFSPVFSAIGLVFIVGLEQLFKRYPFSSKVVTFTAVIFYLAQIYWLVKLVKLT
jgi:hypothetical protein